jgi:hypothetical protein
VSAGEDGAAAAPATAGGPLVSAQPKEGEVLRPLLEGELRALTAHVICRGGALQLPRDLGTAPCLPHMPVHAGKRLYDGRR